MRKEASLEQWRSLYEVATRMKERKPWEKFWDTELIGVRNGEEEETTFFSILGRGGTCYGIATYEGEENLNRFWLLARGEQMNLSPDYTMSNQKNLSCYWGNRNEVSSKQRKVIKDLGYTYCGKNQWLHFVSFEPGFQPYDLNVDEVQRMTAHLHDLEIALQCYEESDVQVDFGAGNMFLLTFGKDKKTWRFEEAPLPITSFQFGNVGIRDDVCSQLTKMPKCNVTLEADVSYIGASVTDKKYDRPINPALSLLGDAKAGTIINFKLSEPEEDPRISLVEMILGFIFRYGIPKEIRVSNVIVHAALAYVCDVCKIQLREVKNLQCLDDFRQSMSRFR